MDSLKINPLTRDEAMAKYNFNTPRAKDAPEDARFAELTLRGFTDLCWWNGTAWQYITTQRR
jgi:hypothetical protein